MEDNAVKMYLIYSIKYSGTHFSYSHHTLSDFCRIPYQISFDCLQDAGTCRSKDIQVNCRKMLKSCLRYMYIKIIVKYCTLWPVETSAITCASSKPSNMLSCFHKLPLYSVFSARTHIGPWTCDFDSRANSKDYLCIAPNIGSTTFQGIAIRPALLSYWLITMSEENNAGLTGAELF